MKCLRKEMLADVIPYELDKDMEDGFIPYEKVIMNGFVDLNGLIVVDKGKGPVCPYIRTKRGFTFFKKGDYLIIDQDGTKHVCGRDKVFNRYQKMTEEKTTDKLSSDSFYDSMIKKPSENIVVAAQTGGGMSFSSKMSTVKIMGIIDNMKKPFSLMDLYKELEQYPSINKLEAIEVLNNMYNNGLIDISYIDEDQNQQMFKTI